MKTRYVRLFHQLNWRKLGGNARARDARIGSLLRQNSLLEINQLVSSVQNKNRNVNAI